MTDDELDDMVDVWHTCNEGFLDISLEEFICLNTGWTADQYSRWVTTGKQPDVESAIEQDDVSRVRWENDGGVPPRSV